MSKHIPVLLVTGFLGSGKTTFINWLLEQNPDLPISLILNEFGDVALESKFITKRNADVAELANGCLCHAAKGDVPRAIKYILENSPDTEQLVIEASGLSYPDLVKDVLVSGELSQLIRFDMTICVIDAQNFFTLSEKEPLVVSQLADADVGVISKLSLVDADAVTKLEEHLHRLMPKLRLVRFNDELKSSLFLDSNFQVNTEMEVETENHDHEHHHDHQSIWFNEPVALDLRQLTAVMRSWPSTVIRAKGIVTSYHPDTNERLQRLVSFVAGRFEFLPVTENDFAINTDQSALVVIGRDLDENEVRQQLLSCAQS